MVVQFWVKDKIDQADKETIESKASEILEWLDANQEASKEEFEDKQKEVEGIVNPIMTKLYQSAGGAPGGKLPPRLPPGWRHARGRQSDAAL